MRAATGAREQVARRPEREEGGAVEGEQRDDGDATQDGVPAEQVPEGAGEVAVGIERHAVEEVREPDAPDERRTDAADGVRPHPDGAPTRARALRAPLERDHADDQEDEHEQQGDVEAGEHRRVPRREGGEGGASRDDEPDLVAVPDGPDRLEHDSALALVAGQERQQHADAEVEALEQEVPGPEERDDHEPGDLEIHQ
jgi:hypothetical protein